jgi:hypothetical protein
VVSYDANRQEESVDVRDGEPAVEMESESEAMATAEERIMILRMIEQGKISAEDGARLLAALNQGKEKAGGTGPTSTTAFDTSRAVRIRVLDTVTGQQKVNVNVPVGLVRMALRFVPAASGIDSNVIQQALDAGAQGRIVDVVSDDGTRVEIYLE